MAGIASLKEKLLDSDPSCFSESDQDNVLVEAFHDSAHSVFLLELFECQLVGNADEKDENDESNGGQKKRIDHAGDRGGGHDVAITHGRNGHHGEVESVEKTRFLPCRPIDQAPLGIEADNSGENDGGNNGDSE